MNWLKVKYGQVHPTGSILNFLTLIKYHKMPGIAGPSCGEVSMKFLKSRNCCVSLQFITK